MKIQYRCPKCLKRLFSWEKGSDKTTQNALGLEWRKTHGSMLVKCPKCNYISAVEKDRLEQIEK